MAKEITDKQRRKGAFYTPPAFALLGRRYLDNHLGRQWRDEVIWDPACGPGALTAGVYFDQLYSSTLDVEDLDQHHKFKDSISFQMDFLSDEYWDELLDPKKTDCIHYIPQSLKAELWDTSKPLVIFVNPPYGAAGNNNTTEGDSKAGISKNDTNLAMKRDKWGAASQELASQFIYRIYKLHEITGKPIKLGIYNKPNYLCSPNNEKLRSFFLSKFKYLGGFMFQASHFEGLSGLWGCQFSVFETCDGGTVDKNYFKTDLVDYKNKELIKFGEKGLYNLDEV